MQEQICLNFFRSLSRWPWLERWVTRSVVAKSFAAKLRQDCVWWSLWIALYAKQFFFNSIPGRWKTGFPLFCSIIQVSTEKLSPWPFFFFSWRNRLFSKSARRSNRTLLCAVRWHLRLRHYHVLVPAFSRHQEHSLPQWLWHLPLRITGSA